MLFTYTLSQILFWWLLHIALLFWRVIFPFHSRALASVIVGMLLPLTPIIAITVKFAVDAQKRATNEISATEIFLSGGLGYNNARFPPILCGASDREVLFYSTVLPLDLGLAIGGSMLLIIILNVHRVRIFIDIVSEIRNNYMRIFC